MYPFSSSLCGAWLVARLRSRWQPSRLSPIQRLRSSFTSLTNVFRWGAEDFKVNGQWERDALHFHLGPEELMKWHLPQEAYPWWQNLLNILKR